MERGRKGGRERGMGHLRVGFGVFVCGTDRFVFDVAKFIKLVHSVPRTHAFDELSTQQGKVGTWARRRRSG
jgi:hypothetical protein